jgi:hypothetical protein
VTGPLCKCGCGQLLERHSYETERQWEKREASGYFRSKCKKNIHSPAKAPHVAPTMGLISANYARGEGVAQVKDKPWRSVAYTEHVKSLKCCLTGSESTEYLAIDPHHENPKGHGGKSTKCGDERQIPVRHDIHVKMETPGNSRASIYQQYGKDPEEVIAATQAAWLAKGNKAEWR